MRTHRGLSAIVGTVFLVAIVIGALSYVTYSMNVLGNFSESLVTEEKRQKDKQSEAFEITSVNITPTLKLDGVISNTGQVPLEIKSIWIEEVGSPDTTKKFDISKTIAPGYSFDLKNVIDFDMNPTTGYKLKTISSRGTIQTSLINSVDFTPLYLTADIYPKTVPTTFDATIVMTVVNNSTNKAPILNLTPTTFPVIDDSLCSPTCTADWVSGPTPAYYPILKSGESATFSWVYTISGSNADQITFANSLSNGLPGNTAQSSVYVRDVVSSLESGTALTSLGLNEGQGAKGILILHDETFDTPDTSYQMSPTTADIGGDYINLSNEIPNFFLQNSSESITIPTGTWTASIRYHHQYLPDSLVLTGNSQVDSIYHLNDNLDTEPDSSGNNNPLDRCNDGPASSNRVQYQTGNSNPTATATFSPTPTVGNLLIATSVTRTGSSGSTNAAINGEYVNVGSTTSDGWTKIVQNYYYTSSTQRGMAMWYKIAGASEPTVVTSRWDNGATTTNLMIQEFSVSQGGSFTYDVSSSSNSGSSSGTSRTTGATASTSTANNLIVTALLTRDSNTFGSWTNGIGNNINYNVNNMDLDSGFKTDSVQGPKESTASWTTSRVNTAVIAVFSLGDSGQNAPLFVSTDGPDNSPHYEFDGNDCFDSLNVADNSNQDIDRAPSTTSVWFRANNLSALRSTLFYVEDGEADPNKDYYRISLGDGTSGNEGRVVFDFDTDGSHLVKCMSPLDYDDNLWHQIIAVRDGDRSCKLYIDGNTTPVDTDSTTGGSNDIDVKDGNEKIHIGYDGIDDYFIGDIDQVFHWNDLGLGESPTSSSVISDFYNARYGLTSSLVDFSIYKTTQSGVNIEPPIVQSTDHAIAFGDAKDIPLSNEYGDDGLWRHMNFTNLSIPEVTLDPGQRLNFTINFKNGLDPFLRIDDNSMTSSPFASFIQVPEPLTEFASYYTYDNDNILLIIAYNSGPQGSWFQYQGTRAVFENLSSGPSYAGLLCSVNSTMPAILHSDTGNNKCRIGGSNAAYMVDEDRDSLFIPVDNLAYLYFWEIQDRPDQNDAQGNVIQAGTYHLYVFINGYDETGKSFLRQIDVGRVDVFD
ncbi:MAG: hypothetical protein KGZ34_07215 [Nitrosarchaeum sp.]|nr:hypothetical protein [Nitrosarchaeum sp.]